MSKCSEPYYSIFFVIYKEITLSQSAKELWRCATTMRVLSCPMLFMASCTMLSLYWSSALVASSKIKTLELIVETLCSDKPIITVSGVDYPAILVKERLMHINSLHIEYIFDCLANKSHEIRNIKRYLLATLFNAPSTISSYYDAKVRSDCWKGKA